MAKFMHISTKLVLVLDAGQVDGKKVTKRVTISNIREDASADALWELAEALGKLLAYPVAEVRLYKVEELEREAGDREAETDTEATATAGTQVNYDAAARDGLLHNVYAAARAFGGRSKNVLFSSSYNDVYLKELRLSVCRLGNNRTMREAAQADADDVAMTAGAGYRRLHSYDNRGGLPPPLSTPGLPSAKQLSYSPSRVHF